MLEQLSDGDLLRYHAMFEAGVQKSNRFENVKVHGYDTKYFYHVARLLDEAEQILAHGTIDLQRSKEFMKAIRRGEVSQDELMAWSMSKEKDLEQLYHQSTLQYEPDRPKIKALLVQCLEEHYGSLDKVLVLPERP